MATLDFNSVVKPTLDLIMKDPAQTKISITFPPEKLIRQLAASSIDLKRAIENGDTAGIDEIWDLTARIISCNRQLLTVAADDLRFKFGMELEDVVIFFSAFTDFIAEVKDAKN